MGARIRLGQGVTVLRPLLFRFKIRLMARNLVARNGGLGRKGPLHFPHKRCLGQWVPVGIELLVHDLDHASRKGVGRHLISPHPAEADIFPGHRFPHKGMGAAVIQGCLILIAFIKKSIGLAAR